MGLNTTTRTVNDVLLAVQRQFGDESGVQLENADVIRWINDAAEELTNLNKLLKAKSTISTVIGQADYTFPAQSIRQVEALQYDQTYIPNMSFAQAQEQIFRGNAFGAVNPPSNAIPFLWYEWDGTITLYPPPDAVKNLTLFYTQMPVVVTTTSDLLPVSDQYYKTLVKYVMQQAYEMDEDWQASQIKGQQFTDDVNRAGEQEREAQSLTYGVITIYDDFQ